MKQFSLEEYLKNPKRKVVTRDGKDVRIICTDKKWRGDFEIVALVHDATENLEYCSTYYPSGKITASGESALDLCFASTKHEGWINVYRDGENYRPSSAIYNTKEEGEIIANGNNNYITTIKIEWEE